MPRSRIVGKGPDKPKLTDSKFHNISIITSYNAYRDKINEVKSGHFANETHQTLATFYSRDTYQPDFQDNGQHKRRKRHIDPQRENNEINPYLKETLWELPHVCSNNSPGKLRLCIGLPVMIRQNLATECGVTNGAEGKVVGWRSKPLDESGRQLLKVVFVELTSPPKPIQLEGLPLNVVPVTRVQNQTKCLMPNNEILKIYRDQIPLIPNFAMTDYNSQGRTRQYNVVDLQNCRSHQSVYTCLSRGSTYEGTAIIQGFEAKKIKGGISGFLRQEFREIEVLDDVTRLAFHRKLPKTVGGVTRKQIIYTYRKWKGEMHLPRRMSRHIYWSKYQPWENSEPKEEEIWHLIKNEPKQKKANATSKLNQTSNNGTKKKLAVSTSFIPAKGTNTLKTLSDDLAKRFKRKRQNEEIDANLEQSSFKKLKLSNSLSTTKEGFTWSDNSCAYDSLFSILFDALRHKPQYWNSKLVSQNSFFKLFTRVFTDISDHSDALNDARDAVRLELHQKDEASFPLNSSKGTDIFALCREILEEDSNCYQRLFTCKRCKTSQKAANEYAENYKLAMFDCSPRQWRKKLSTKKVGKQRTAHDWLAANIEQTTKFSCSSCNRPLISELKFDRTPFFILFHVDKGINALWNLTLNFNDAEYRLCGMIYFKEFHFTARVISSNKEVQFYNSLNSCEPLSEGNFEDLSSTMLSKDPDGRMLSIVFYIHV